MIHDLCTSTVCLMWKLPHVLPETKSCFNLITLLGSTCLIDAKETNQFYAGGAFFLFLFYGVKLLNPSVFNTPHMS